MSSTSGFYADTIIGKLRPPANAIQWDIGKSDPSGYRHWESGYYKPLAKLSNIGGFKAQKESGVALDFGDVYFDASGFYSDTICLTLNLGEINNNPNSYFDLCDTIGSNFKAFNIKFWLASSGAFSINANKPTFYFKDSKTWLGNIALQSTTPGASVVPLSMPTSQNVFSKNNNIYISGCYKDLEHTHYVYLVAKFPAGSYILGGYGGLGSGNFIFKVSYDWTDINANTIGEDVVD